MSDHGQLVAFWRSRLSASEEQLAHGSSHLRWLRRMYIRVYRFLLSQYGEASDSPPASETPVSLMPLVDNTDRHGRPPKQPGKIQAILKDIHVANERLDKPGPLAKGMAPGSWLVVASRREKWIPGACLAMLRASGIAARLTYSGGDVAVEVDGKDLEVASRILHASRRELTCANQPGSLFAVMAAAMGFGALLGCIAGALLTAAVAAWGVIGAGIILGMAGVGALWGGACQYVEWHAPPQRRQVRILRRETADFPEDAFPACFGVFCGMIIGAFLWGVAMFSDRFAGAGYELAQWTPVMIVLGGAIGFILGRAFSRWRK